MPEKRLHRATPELKEAVEHEWNPPDHIPEPV